MTITEILDSEMKDTEKVAKVAEIVTKAREAYGNTKLEVESPVIATTGGNISIEYLSLKDKLAVIKRAAAQILIEASEIVKAEDGFVFEKEVERLIAVSPVFCNVAASTGSKYI